MDREKFAGTSVLWAYESINPLLIAAKIDIWRLAILWMYGGVYIDDDSLLGDPLTSIIMAEDEFIYGVENNPYRTCFVSEHPYGKYRPEALNQCCNVTTHVVESQPPVHTGSPHVANQIVNWLILARPQHPFWKRHCAELL